MPKDKDKCHFYVKDGKRKYLTDKELKKLIKLGCVPIKKDDFIPVN